MLPNPLGGISERLKLTPGKESADVNLVSRTLLLCPDGDSDAGSEVVVEPVEDTPKVLEADSPCQQAEDFEQEGFAADGVGYLVVETPAMFLVVYSWPDGRENVWAEKRAVVS